MVLTFAADALMNFLADRPQLVNAVAPLEFEPQIQDLRQSDFGPGDEPLSKFRERIKGTRRLTIFFIRPKQSCRALWFLHLSRHRPASDEHAIGTVSIHSNTTGPGL